MLYLGTLDDKSIQYPFGGTGSKGATGHKAILHRLLFCRERLLVEEGFVLASEEARHPGRARSVFLPAIRAGLIRVATRHGDMQAYALERRALQHAGPPQTPQGQQYLVDLQSACVAANAFVQYPPDHVDELTYSRLRSVATLDMAHATLSTSALRLPTDFSQQYEYRYRKGNQGKQWTARAAWEAALQLTFPKEPHAVHALMALANRERQLIRAAAISKVNNLAQLHVETGFETTPHDLAVPVVHEASRQQPISHEGIFPKICADMLMRHLDRLLAVLAQQDSTLNRQRLGYLALLSRSGPVDLDELRRVARRYEDEIYAVAGETQPENMDSYRLAGSLVIGTALSASVSALLSSRAHNREDLQVHLKSQLKRRDFLGTLVSGALMTSVAYAGLKLEDAYGDNVVRAKREQWEDHVLDDFASHFDPSRRSHQILRVDPAGIAGMRI
ncbi:MAG: hypothetical protein ACT6SF_05980 [Hydrogenophaga sp.]|jgi:hypothetical protein|uniref:hypothetical protein n=1 Tax=Hydrogenophaga sp. TaxID=1904254 RepID=UPI001D75196E|nr:hypothetical protein [Hydrogenophaga sp.]MBW0169873.1 hypothetical protein [Hydrogenophaga sp.]MBW0185865.1 hypothetical protein [Hydrogenophaga sp.]